MQRIEEAVKEVFSVADLVIVRVLLLALMIEGALKLFHSFM
jgi:hypothetical protein